jgi:hypothetical protein
MTTSLPRIMGILFLAVGLSLSTSSSASASAGPEFGQHVHACVQVMGFDGTHNPGMHTGYAGWDPTHVC